MIIPILCNASFLIEKRMKVLFCSSLKGRWLGMPLFAKQVTRCRSGDFPRHAGKLAGYKGNTSSSGYGSLYT